MIPLLSGLAGFGHNFLEPFFLPHRNIDNIGDLFFVLKRTGDKNTKKEAKYPKTLDSLKLTPVLCSKISYAKQLPFASINASAIRWRAAMTLKGAYLVNRFKPINIILWLSPSEKPQMACLPCKLICSKALVK